MGEIALNLRPFTGRPARRLPPGTPLPERLATFIDYQGPAACWEWRGSVSSGTGGGYARLKVDGRAVAVHRLVYELLVGPVPEGLELDHLCRNRACCNPSHLEPVSHRENVLRGTAAARTRAWYVTRTHCKRGHPFTPGETPGKRECVLCRRMRRRALAKRVRDGELVAP